MRAVAWTEAPSGGGGPAVVLPAWAEVSERRRAHIERVTALLDRWAAALDLPPAERRAWHDAGLLHDALRDAPEPVLRALAGDAEAPVEMLHGPAAAERLAAEGERRTSVLEAVRWHTIGHAGWDRVGRALFMADFLEPGRSFDRAGRRFLADMVPHDFDGAFRQVLRSRLEWTIREGKSLFPGTVHLWNAVR
jgi:2-amino-4-hydroxy-6-hydroxymethyldihydropteridine diphosphokinase